MTVRKKGRAALDVPANRREVSIAQGVTPATVAPGDAKTARGADLVWLGRINLAVQLKWTEQSGQC